MCLLCVEYEKGKMTNQEALNNIGEMLDGKSEDEMRHLFELAEKIVDKEMPFQEWDDEEFTGSLDDLYTFESED